MSKHAMKAGLGALALAATLSLAACADDTDAGGMGGMGGMASSSAAPSSSTAAPSSPEPSVAKTPASGPQNDADVMFAQMMIPHHQQAVEMSDLMLAKADADPRILTLAQQIKAAQAPEITQMTGWLEGWGFKVQPMDNDMDHSGHAGSGMDGMMSETDMKELEAASGADASRMFLEGMVKHHEGAVEMAQAEVSDGENPDAIKLAEAIVTTQQQEITDMKDLLTQL
ncbi:DUF305 domain-containing protein [Friedmanniella luteola]|nr:DUF305 domain-containing protein [Friedmanniella luteola]